MTFQENCAKYVAFLRTLYLLHQNNHWLSNGYAEHLLFERLYKTAQDDTDLAAEKFIGLFGTEALCADQQPNLIQECFQKYAASNNLVKNSLEAEEAFLAFSQEFYDLCETEKKMSLGLDDMIMSIASSRETAVYLFKQSLGTTKLSEIADRFQKLIKN